MHNFWQIKIRKICRKYATIFDENILIAYWSGLAARCRSRLSLCFAKFSITTKDKPFLIDNDNFSYIFNNQNGIRYWSCSMTGCNSRLRTLNDKDGLPTSELAPGCTIPQHREIYMSKFGEEIAAKKIMKDMRL